MRTFLLILAVAGGCSGAEFPELRARQPWRPDASLARQQVDWRRMLENNEIRFLTDNQLSLTLSHEPGIARFQYYPTRRRVELIGKLDYHKVGLGTQFQGQGAKLEFRDAQGGVVKLAERNYTWAPDRVSRSWENEATRITEEIAVAGNLAVVRLTRVSGPPLEVTLSGSFPYSFETRGTASLCFDNGVCLAPGWAEGPKPEMVKDGYVLHGRLDTKLEFVAAVGYTPEVAAERNRVAPAAIFEQARATWDYYFTALVPRLATANARLDRLYYYLFYVVRSSLFDIPFEPYRYAYTCPWKTGAIWQWSWNTPMNSITERWLNDPSLSKEGIRMIAENGGAMYFGTYLHPWRRFEPRLGIFDWYLEVDKAQKKLERTDYDFLSVMPYTVPNAFLGIWEVYRMTGDTEFLKQSLPLMQDYEQSARRLAKPGTILAPFQMMVDEYDYSLRWKPVQKGFTKRGLQRAFDVPVLMADVNSYLYALRTMLEEAWRTTGDTARADEMHKLARQTADEVNARLWDAKLNFYCDARADTGASTEVRAMSGFAPFAVGLAPKERRAAMLRSLDDPKGFAATYPYPSVELSNPDSDPNIATYGGDSSITTGVWTILNMLASEGENERASRDLRRVIEMMTRNGVSSSYSYNSTTGTPNQRQHELSTQSAIVNDLIARYIVGFTPRTDDRFEFNPLAAAIAGERLTWGPFRYKGKHTIRVEMTPRQWKVSVDSKSFTAPKPRHVVLRLGKDGLRLAQP